MRNGSKWTYRSIKYTLIVWLDIVSRYRLYIQAISGCNISRLHKLNIILWHLKYIYKWDPKFLILILASNCDLVRNYPSLNTWYFQTLPGIQGLSWSANGGENVCLTSPYFEVGEGVFSYRWHCRVDKCFPFIPSDISWMSWSSSSPGTYTGALHKDLLSNMGFLYKNKKTMCNTSRLQLPLCIMPLLAHNNIIYMDSPSILKLIKITRFYVTCQFKLLIVTFPSLLGHNKMRHVRISFL